MNRSLSLGKSQRQVFQVFPASSLLLVTIMARRSARPWETKKALSRLKIGLDLFLELFDRDIADHPLAVNEKGRGRFDVQHFGGAIPHVLDAVQHLLILEAGIE